MRGEVAAPRRHTGGPRDESGRVGGDAEGRRARPGGDVAREDDVGIARHPHPHVVRGPRADPGERQEGRALGDAVVARAEVEVAARDRRGRAGDRPDAGRGAAQDLVPAFGDRRHRGEEAIGPLVLGDLRTEDGGEVRQRGAGGGDGHLLADHRAHEHLGRIDGPRHPDAGGARDRGRQLGLTCERVVDRSRVGVEIEQPPRPRDERRQIAHAGESRLQADPGALGADPEPGGAAGERQRARIGRRGRDLDARQGTRRHPRRVERTSVREHQVDGPRVRRPRRVRRPPPCTQLERRHPEHLAHRLVELTDAREAGRERHVGGREVGAHQEQARRVSPMRAGEGERAGAELRGEDAAEVTRRVAETPGQARHALALDDAVGDEAHGATRGVAAQIPRRRAGRRLRETALAGPVAGLVRGRRGGVERDVGGLGRPCRAARPAVDPGRAHRRHELPVEARVAGFDHAVALVECHALAAHLFSLTRSGDIGSRESAIAVATGAAT